MTAFPIAAGLQLTLVAVHPTLVPAFEQWLATGADGDRDSVAFQHVGASDLLEIRVPLTTDPEAYAV